MANIAVKFTPPSACRVQLSFFERLYEHKLDERGLDDSSEAVRAFLGASEGVTQWLLRADSLTPSLTHSSTHSSTHSPTPESWSCSGVLKNVNTTNEFITLDKPALLTDVGVGVWENIVSGEVVESPNSLFEFVFLSFADLKQYRFTYWLGFPTFVAAIPYRHHSPPQLLNFFPNSGSGTGGNDDEYVQVADSDNTDCSFPSPVCLQQVHAWSQASHSQVVFAIVNQDGNSKICSLADSWALLKQSDVAVDVVFCVKDVHGAFLLNREAGETEATYTPGWGVRNVLAFLAHCLPNTVSSSDRVVKILCIQSHAVPSATPSGGSQGRLCFPLLTVTLPVDCLGPAVSSGEMPRVVGWQANERGKPGPRVLDAAIVMDTRRIMEQAVDLNVRLMKWRLWPSLDTAMLSSTKCLLLGAGTLGCAVARTLMGWGVRDITLVDNGRVSYSNPARQSLFEFKDCEEKAYKSEAAARRLQAIFPGMRAKGLVITIPMPGHRAVSEKDSEFLRGETKKLDDLVQSHDVVFALTDSREARWLPTVQCAAHDKLLINAALGFDSYLVMRHGHGGPEVASGDASSGPQSEMMGNASAGRLGCYFCMDVIGPGNSQRDRTLDQQCTVTRPGLAQIASGLAAELMVALLHSPLRQRTPALMPGSRSTQATDGTGGDEDNEGCEPLPHQIRGVLGKFTQVNPVCSSFQHCTACSPAIIRKYWPGDCDGDEKKSGEEGSSFTEFVEEVCNDPGGLLEKISGVAGLIAGLDDLDLDLDMSDESEGEGSVNSDDL